MATSKQPHFPHPALEVGVPQYPTPNVPDFYKKDGHIILVDKISADKGSYNPAPLDGSITYAGKDANKFPAPLYLVRETPTPDGLFVYRTWANDRTYASQDPWNYGVSYSSENPDYPIYTREYFTPRDQYVPIAIGAVDPVFGRTAIVVKQEMKELAEDHPLRSRHVQVVVQYETVPGPRIKSSKLDPFTGTRTIDSYEQIVVAGQEALIPKVGVAQEYVGIDSIKSKLEQKDYSNLLGYSWVEYETVSHTFPAYIIFSRSNPSSLQHIDKYVQARSLRVQGTVTYTIINDDYWPALIDAPVNFSTVTLNTDFGTFSNVIHNASTVLSGGEQLKALSSTVYVDSPYLPFAKEISSNSNIFFNTRGTYRDFFAAGGAYYQATGGGILSYPAVQIPISISNTIIKEMGGLRLLKITSVPLI